MPAIRVDQLQWRGLFAGTALFAICDLLLKRGSASSATARPPGAQELLRLRAKLGTEWPREAERHVTKLTYQLEPTSEGTKLTVRHEGFKDRSEQCGSHAGGWEMVLAGNS